MANSDLIHKFMCVYCKNWSFGDTATILAQRVNDHNKFHHPMDYSKWDADAVVRSVNYRGPATPSSPGALPEYLVGHGTSPNSPHLTEDDRQFLAKARVKW